ncbi:MAG TPA: hypothetical protein VIZ68_04630 [Thermoplasmata archaeon]
MPEWAAAGGAVVLVLLVQQLFFPVALGPSGDLIRLHYSDFRQFSSAPPGSVRFDDSSWLMFEPYAPRHDGKLGVADAESLRAFSLGTLSFTTTFLAGASGDGRPSHFADEMVVFATSDPTTFHGTEFGVRMSLSDGFVYAYWQFPSPFGGVVFQEHRLFANDGRSHGYDLSLVGATVSFSVDGTISSAGLFPLLPPGEYYIVATAHRASEGWSASGLGLSVSGFTVQGA